MAERIVIIGGKGFVGASLTRCLLRRGHPVTVVEPRGTPGRLADVAQDVEWIVGDGARLETVLRALGRRHVQGLYVGPFYRSATRENLDTELDIMAASVWRTFQLARAIPLRRIVFPSSTAVHGPQPPDGSPVHERSRIAPYPHGLYGAAKLLCEQMGAEVNAALGHNVVTSVRLPSVYGPGADVASRQVNVPAVQAARGEPAVLEHSSSARVCIAHVEDVGEALAAMFEPAEMRHSVYELGGLNVSFGDLAEAAAAVIPGAVTSFGSVDRAILPHAVDNSRIRAEFDVSHRTLLDGTRSIVAHEASATDQRQDL